MPRDTLDLQAEATLFPNEIEMYDHSTAFYDLIYRELKDYHDEAAKIHTLLERLPGSPHRLLDVGCGTGEHARILAQTYHYAVNGVDIQPGFVKIAAQKLPESQFTVADMRDFDLGERYDAVLCLFSSIAYVETLDGLRRAARCLARHVNPGGWLVCEPWLTPEEWFSGKSDTVSAVDHRTGERIERKRSGETDGNVSVLTIEYTVSDETDSRSFSETHRLGLFEREDMTAALRDAGLEPQWVPLGLHANNIVLARNTL